MTTAGIQRRRAIAVAMYARRFCLLATNPEYRAGGERRRAALDAETHDENQLVGMSELVQIACAGPMDALCAEAVAAMNKPGAFPDLCEFLTMLPEDRAVGIFYALGPATRKAALRQAYWRELVAAGPGADAVRQASWDLGEADALGVGPWVRDVVHYLIPNDH